MSNFVPVNKLKSGSYNINLSFDGTSPINKVYVGEDLALVRFAEYPKLKVSADTLLFEASADPQTVIITTNTNWSASTSANWVTLSTSGDELTVSVAVYESDVEDRTATVTVFAWNADATISETISITQKKVVHVVYLQSIYRSGTATWNTAYNIEIPIYPADDCEMDLNYWPRGVTSDRIVGVSPPDRTDGNDNKDFRLFGYASGTLDVNSQRWSSVGISSSIGYYYRLTIGNAFVYNNYTESYMLNQTPQTPLLASDTHIHVDVGSNKVGLLRVRNGGVVVFDGKAAYDPETGKYGLYDEVSKQLYTNNNLTMTGDELT